MDTVVEAKSGGALILRLIVGLALLGCPRMGSAAGTWSVISLERKGRQINSPTCLALDMAGNLYVAAGGGIQKRDALGNWSVIATFAGVRPGQGLDPSCLAVDAAGYLYVVDDETYRVLEWTSHSRT